MASRPEHLLFLAQVEGESFVRLVLRTRHTGPGNEAEFPSADKAASVSEATCLEYEHSVIYSPLNLLTALKLHPMETNQ